MGYLNQNKQIKHHQSVHARLLASFIAISVVPIILCGFFMIFLFQAMALNTHRSTVKKETEEINTAFHTFINGIDTTLSALSSHSELITSADRETMYNLLYETTDQYRNNATFSIYDLCGNCIYSTGELQNRPAYWGILHALQNNSQKVISQVDSEADKMILNIATTIQQDKTAVGYIVASVNDENFVYLFTNKLSNNDGFCIVSQENEAIFINSVLQASGNFKKLHYAWITDSAYEESLKDYHITVDDLGYTGFKQIILQPKIFHTSTIHRMYIMVGLLGVFSLLVCMIAAQKITTSFIQPINRMNMAMKEVQEGKLDISIPVTRNDEFGILSQNFNVMTQELGNFLEQKVETQKRLSDIQIAMMQAQLNPHFLYNTLDTIKWMAKRAKAEPISQLSQKLARILRTSIVKEQFITIAEEFQICADYGEIQNIRFQGKYRFTFDYPQNLTTYKIPKLIIQPLVENAIIHGLREQESGFIKVSASVEKDSILLSVQDNGVGIDDEMMQCIETHQWNQINGHIGLYNVDSILRLHYGVNSGLHAQRLKEGGTLMQITLPYQEESCIK